jgi:CBS domain-containing protein
MYIKDVMSHPVITAPAGSTLDEVARLMREFDCGIVPIVASDGRLTGVVTDRDICMAAYTQGKPLAAIAVESAASTTVIACHAEDSIERVEHLMRDHQIRRVPVLDNENRPVGMVAVNDLVRLGVRAKKSGVDRELVRTLGAICRPHAHTAPGSDRVVA